MNSNAPIKIKFMTKAPVDFSRQDWISKFPQSRPVWGRCQYTFDPFATEYDWLVVYDDLPSMSGERCTRWEEELACPPENTLLITTEPSTVKTYGQGYLRQFGHILTSQEPWAIRHPGAIYSQSGFVWFYGKNAGDVDYDYLKSHRPESKTQVVSTVCSSKKQKQTLHHRRYTFTQKLKSKMPELEVFGHGVRFIEDKADALDPYRYHVAIENHICKHYWTEKLTDCFLGMTLPFYCGCPNLTDYFPEEAFIPIDIFNFEETHQRIQQTIQDREFEKRLPALREARRLVLEKYATIPLVSQLVETHNVRRQPGLQIKHSILSRHEWRNRKLSHQISFGLEKAMFRVVHGLRSIA